MVSNRLTETRGAVDPVIEENTGGKSIGEGTADLIWLSGDNFLALAEQDLLFGAFAESLPNAKHFDWNPKDHRSHPNLFGFGTPILRREIPWSSEQFVCAVNRDLVSLDQTPSNFVELKFYL